MGLEGRTRSRDVDETYVKAAGTWRYLYRAIDQFGQVVDLLLSTQRDARAARRFFGRAIRHPHRQSRSRLSLTEPVLTPASSTSCFRPPSTTAISTPTTRSRPTTVRLKARLRPRRGLKSAASTLRISLGHAFVQNLRRGHYGLAMEMPANRRLATAFAELALVI
jgi:IS6 family transposase